MSSVFLANSKETMFVFNPSDNKIEITVLLDSMGYENVQYHKGVIKANGSETIIKKDECLLISHDKLIPINASLFNAIFKIKDGELITTLRIENKRLDKLNNAFDCLSILFGCCVIMYILGLLQSLWSNDDILIMSIMTIALGYCWNSFRPFIQQNKQKQSFIYFFKNNLEKIRKQN